jgi:hypothetical protein
LGERERAFLCACAALGCASEAPAGQSPEVCSSLHFAPALAAGVNEAYGCFAFDSSALGGPLRSASWNLGSENGVVLHHATLYTTSELRPRGRLFDCDPMPLDALAVHVGVPGSESFALPPDTGMVLRSDTRSLIVEVHMFRSGDGPDTASLSMCTATNTPARLAGRFAHGAPVPALRPRHTETSTARCRMPRDLDLLSSWPHMHRLGKGFHAALLRGDERLPILDLETWDFNQQLTYPVEVHVQAGDVLETTCVWRNDSEQYVLPGLFTNDEMCAHGLMGFPADAAYCEPD